MSARGPSSPELIANPLIKKRNLEWSLDAPVSSRFLNKPQSEPKSLDGGPSTAAIEDGSETHHDPLEIFSKTLSAHIQPSQPTLPVSTYRTLYTSNAGSRHGAHFVIHQHDHPVAGTHYDLRLQCNENSSVSWAVMYGLPGDGNSVRLNRNATETRVHCLWVCSSLRSFLTYITWDTALTRGRTILLRRRLNTQVVCSSGIRGRTLSFRGRASTPREKTLTLSHPPRRKQRQPKPSSSSYTRHSRTARSGCSCMARSCRSLTYST